MIIHNVRCNVLKVSQTMPSLHMLKQDKQSLSCIQVLVRLERSLA